MDITLQPIVKDQALYFKNLADLKSDLENLDLPPNASLFMYDAMVMYPSIDTADCLACLSEYLSDPEVSTMYGFSSADLLEALELVMFNNCMKFGDIIVKKISGIAMGMSLAVETAGENVCCSGTPYFLLNRKYVHVSVCRLSCDCYCPNRPRARDALMLTYSSKKILYCYSTSTAISKGCGEQLCVPRLTSYSKAPTRLFSYQIFLLLKHMYREKALIPYSRILANYRNLP